tara:strand:- start:5730 stop:6302 length:573 start_codon:yes stop_codon:yes gene_type:complete
MNFFTVSNLDIKMSFISNEMSLDESWRQDIFVQTKFFADFQVKKFSYLSNDPDVKQDAYLGLWEAIITFDYHKNFDFYRWAQWNILKKIRDNRRNSKRFFEAKSSIKEELNTCDSTESLVSQEDMLEASYLYKQIILKNDFHLSKPELDILFKSVIEKRKLREIASDYSLSQERIRQIKNVALNKIKEKF